MIKFILTSLKSFWKEKKMWLLLFSFSLIPALFFGLMFYKKTMGLIGTSMATDRLFHDFDYITFSDLMRNTNKTLKPLLSGTLVGGFVFLIVNIFLTGGVAHRAINSQENFSIAAFFSKSLQRFPKFLLLYLLVAILAFCLFLACGLLFFIFSLMADNGNDRSLFIWLFLPTMALSLSMIYSVCVNDYAKILLVKHPSISSSQAFFESLRYIWNQPKSLLYFCLLILLGLLSLALYLLLDTTIGMTSIVGMGLMIVVQQLYSFFRVFLRFSHLKVASDNYKLSPLIIENHTLKQKEENSYENKEPPFTQKGLNEED